MADRRRLAAVLATAAALALAGLVGAPASRAVAAAPAAGPAPVLAYFYIWFNASSWNRAKRDTPLVGRYSSDERSVMARQVAWAQQAGIDGFIVSWKSTPTLDRRLRTLIGVAARAHFGLALTYEGLDFHRRPLPAARVRSDLQLFGRRYAGAAPFRRYGRPLVIWSGTWRFTPAEVAGVTRGLPRSMLVLASEKSASAYARVARWFDGDAYYWSSADPLHTPGHVRKLRQMGAAVHRRHGIWVAPAAPGFDARLIGGRTAVPRRGGDTLRRSLDDATTSAPDVLGLISWNEFTENTYVEPSRRYGVQALRVLADVLGAQPPVAGDLDSSRSAATGARYGLPLIGGFAAVLVSGALLLGRRRRRGAAAAGRTGASADRPAL
jgi:hypothetical protein